MLTIVTTAAKFALGYVAADRAIALTKEIRKSRRYKQNWADMRNGNAKINFEPLFNG